MRPILCFMRYSFLAIFRYRTNQLWPITQPILLALPALLVALWGEKLGTLESFAGATGTKSYAAYILLGALYWNFVEVVWWIPLSVWGAMRQGTLETLWASPISRIGVIVGWAGARALTVLPSFAVGVVLLGIFHPFPTELALGQALLVLFLSLVGSYGLAFAMVGLTLRFKDAESIVSIVGNSAPLIGGVFFPVHFLPWPLRVFAFLFPFTYGADALRALWFGSPTLFPLSLQFLLLAVVALFFFVLGWAVFRYLERKSREGSLGTF